MPDHTDALPLGWTRRRLGDVLKLRNGYAFKPTEWASTGQPIIRIQNLKSKSAPFNHYDGDLPDKFRAKTGDLLFAWSGTPGTSFGAHIWEGPDAWINQHIFRVDFSEQDFDRDFLKLAFNHNLDDYISEAQGGVGLAHITKAKLNESLLIAPPVDVQRSIAALIAICESKQADSAGHLATAKRAIERFRQAVLAAASSGQLTADWREEHAVTDSAHALVERSKDAAVRAGMRIRAVEKPSPDYLEIPETWEWAPLGWLAAIKGGIQKQPKRAPKNNAYPYLRVANVLRGRLDLGEIHKMELFPGELETYRLEDNDLLIIEGNGSLSEIGRSAIWSGEIQNCVHQNHIIRVRCLEMDSEYINAFWNSPIGAREIAELAVTSAGLYNLSVGKVSAFPVPVPPIEEQQEIVRRVIAFTKMADDLLIHIDSAASAVKRSSQSALAKAFRGELLIAVNEPEAEVALPSGGAS